MLFNVSNQDLAQAQLANDGFSYINTYVLREKLGFLCLLLFLNACYISIGLPVCMSVLALDNHVRFSLITMNAMHSVINLLSYYHSVHCDK